MIFKKGIATILSSATLLTAVSPCVFAENNSEGKNTSSMSTTGKVLLGAAGAVGLAATAGIIYHAVKNSHVKVETLKGKPIYEKYMELKDAVIKGEYNKVEDFLNENKELDINAIYFTPRATLLHKAAWKNDVTMCNLLIDRGADINAKNDDGETPLHLAAYNGYTNICKLLIDKGANVNAKQWYGGMTPLHRAFCRNNLETCKVLIKNNANVNIRANSGKTPLEKSILNNDKEMCDLLIKNGADVNLRNNQGETPLHKAASFSRYDICKLLIDNGADVNARDNNGFTPLHSVLDNLYCEDKLPVVELLIKKGADVNAIAYRDRTPLLRAIIGIRKEDRLSAIKLLIDNGADINYKDKKGHTPLDYVEYLEYSKEAQQWLIKHGAKHGNELK